jgi:Toastrack DUF4097
MRTKVIAALLAILTALGGLNLYQSIRDRLLPSAKAETIAYAVEPAAPAPVSETRLVRVSERGVVVIDKTFDVSFGDALLVDIQHADVTVTTGSFETARVLVTISGRDIDRARKSFEEMEFQADRVDHRIELISRKRRRNWSFRGNGGLSIKAEITIPEKFDVDMETTHGDVSLDNLIGILHLKTSHGKVSAQSVSGGEISITSSHGRIRASSLSGAEIELKTSHADIDVARINSDHFSAITSHSNVEVDELSGISDIRTSHGNIDITINEDLSADLTTSHGNISVSTPPTFGADLDLKGGRIRLASTFDFTGSIKKDSARGQLNGGGPRIEARTSHGKISIRSN